MNKTSNKSSPSQPTANPSGEKLQKILARAGFGSRREVERLIESGLVKVNNKVATLGDRAMPDDNIKVRDQAVKETRLAKQATQVILYNKPEGQVCSRKDEKGRDTVYLHLPRIINGRWVSIGRLDLNTSGLLIFTNNGELANRMMHPSYEIEREYSVRVFGEVTDEIIKTLKKGVKLEDGVAKFDKVDRLQMQEEDSVNQWYRVVLKEGKNREVRRMWESQGVKVSRLIRTRYGEFSLPRNLRRGKTEPLTWKQVNQLLKSVDLSAEPRPDLTPKAQEKSPRSDKSSRKPTGDRPQSKRTSSSPYKGRRRD
ncbi:23S rRNA pseudouridine(2605) synthase RluB [Hydrogenovibrio kuenenii]|uniref:23S rRNA pseudouridine(2605) synthase RluB n=1 Tax=Hydrogenovibrio kuenenii TaxID=63658 RepID=UPI000464EE4A|nr:pseudouridine synthase [Hydrogenovibrio kuenenii]